MGEREECLIRAAAGDTWHLLGTRPWLLFEVTFGYSGNFTGMLTVKWDGKKGKEGWRGKAVRRRGRWLKGRVLR